MRLNVGDLARITGSRFRPDLIGQVCTIIKPYEYRLCAMPDGSERFHYRYVVRLLDGSEGAFSFRHLVPIGEPPRERELVAAEGKSGD